VPARLMRGAWRSLRRPGMPLGVVLAVAVGVGGGLGAVALRWLIGQFHWAFFVGGAKALWWLGPYYVVAVPAAGGLLVGLVVTFVAHEAKGHDVPEVMLAVARRGGRIRRRLVVGVTLASSLCIGSGGSVGTQGPIVQVGSGLGCLLGQMLRLPTAWLRLLVGCGAAAGISAMFNTPIGGCLFTMELLFRSFTARGFALVAISAVVGNMVAVGFLGNSPPLGVGDVYRLVDSREMLLFAGMGVLTGLVGAAFIKALHHSQDFWEWLPGVPEWCKPMLGGLVVGCVGLYSLDLLGVGYGEVAWTSTRSLDHALAGHIPLGALAVLVVLKIVATSTTLGSGGSGGVFAPSLFIGAMTGGIVGVAAERLFPGVTAGEGGYALAGAAALFAGVSRAPITAVVIIFELTRDYALILPVMTAVIISTGIVRLFSRETIYTEKLMRRGIDILKTGRASLVAAVRVGDVMAADFPTVPAAMSLGELAARFQETGHHGFPVLDEQGKLFGVVTLADLRKARSRPGHGTLTAGDICTRSLLTAYPDETVGEVLARTAERNVGRIPVVAPDDERRLLGVLRRASLVEAWRHAIEHGEEVI